MSSETQLARELIEMSDELCQIDESADLKHVRQKINIICTHKMTVQQSLLKYHITMLTKGSLYANDDDYLEVVHWYGDFIRTTGITR